MQILGLRVESGVFRVYQYLLDGAGRPISDPLRAGRVVKLVIATVGSIG